ncbi:MAG: NAD-dependent epimerase/dehydratase family protein [Candidatus Aenigmatarchaeota archaeon]|nr:NAD-dependent epimerase/dehydratase family protein [Candidatus Aenigmarchaeota archaeon]
MKILVTGGCGFIGSHTIDLLIENGHDVIVIDKVLRKENLNPKAKYIKLDITSKKLKSIIKKESPEILLHLAASINIRNSLEKPIEFAKNNIIGTINILDSCISSDIKKIIFSSSVAVYGEPKYLPVDEKHEIIMPNSLDSKDSSLKPINPYAISKIASEFYIQMFNQIYGIDYVILRYANVYGPRQSLSSGAVIPSFIEKLLSDQQPIIYGDGKQTRDFVYVEDVARANMLAINWKRGIYNIGSGKETSIIDILQKIKAITKKNIDAIFLEQKNEIKRIFVSIEKAKKLGWKPLIDIDEGIKRTIEYFNANKNKQL